METLTIGVAARRSGVTPKAIRLYEQRGLLPAADRTASGYRLFTEADIDTLGFIRRARALGLRLDDITEILTIADGGTPPCATVDQLIDSRIADIDATIADLRQLRSTLQVAKERSTGADAAICAIIEGDES